MDFQISHYLGQTQVKCSMEHQAFAHWFNQESADRQHLQSILKKIQKLQAGQLYGEQLIEGKEYSLYIDKEQVICQANNLISPMDNPEPLEPHFYYYEAESRACCGLEDFIKLLQSYLAFP